MEKRLLFAFNPQAGKGEIRQKLLPVVQIFNEGGYDVTVRPTRRGGELPSIVAGEASNYDLLVVSGGDGTLNEAIAGLKFQRDVAETAYKAAMEAINVYKLNIKVLEEQIQREWNCK